jgi:hypothetical protein
MPREWISGNEGKNLKFKRETLLNCGRVFFIYSIKSSGKKKKIYNTEVIDEIRLEIKKLKQTA